MCVNHITHSIIYDSIKIGLIIRVSTLQTQTTFPLYNNMNICEQYEQDSICVEEEDLYTEKELYSIFAQNEIPIE